MSGIVSKGIRFFFFLRFFIYSFMIERERQREKQAPCREPDVRLDPGTPRSRLGPKAGAKPLSHPGIPSHLFLNSFIEVWLTHTTRIYIMQFDRFWPMFTSVKPWPQTRSWTYPSPPEVSFCPFVYLLPIPFFPCWAYRQLLFCPLSLYFSLHFRELYKSRITPYVFIFVWLLSLNIIESHCH